MPVIQAARDAHLLDRLNVIATDLFPALIEQIRAGKVSATIHQRPYMQGRLAFRILQEYLIHGRYPASPVTLAPHLVMAGNLDFFLEKQASDGSSVRAAASDLPSDLTYNNYD